MINYATPDLTQHPPRSLRVRLGGYAHLPRLLDKARAIAAGVGGEYDYNCGTDRRFFDFTGIDHEVMMTEIKSGKSDVQMLEWVAGRAKRSPHEIVAWSQWLENNGPGGPDGHAWFAEELKARASDRDDLRSFADFLDWDDYLSFGGKV